MLHDQNTTPEEQMKSFTNVGEVLNEKSNSIEKEEVINTPFHIVGNEIVGYFIVLGKYRLTEHHKTKKELMDWWNKNDWDFVINLIITLIAADQDMKGAIKTGLKY